MGYQFIISERLDGVALITLNRPEKLNALSFPLMEELDHALTGYEADDDVKAVILTGAGERAFSAGADIHEMAGLSSEELARRSVAVVTPASTFARQSSGSSSRTAVRRSAETTIPSAGTAPPA